MASRFDLLRSVPLVFAVTLTTLVPNVLRAGDYVAKSANTLRLAGMTTASTPTPYALIKTSENGYLIAGALTPWQPFVIKLSATGNAEWQRVVEDRGVRMTSTYSVIEADGGGALLIGDTNSPDVMPGRWYPNDQDRRYFGGISDSPYAVRLDNKGDLLWRRAYGKFDKQYGGSFACGARLMNGFVLAGIKPKDWADQPVRGGILTKSALWIVMLDDKGMVVWESEIATDGDDLVDTVHLKQRQCSFARPESSAIAFAVSVEGRHTVVRDGHRVIYGDETYGIDDFVLVVRVDVSAGRELGRFRLDAGTVPRLFRQPGGYAVIDNLVSRDRSRRGVRATFLDDDLKPTSQHITRVGASYFEAEATVADQGRGFHLAGYHVTPPNQRGVSALAYLTATGQLVRITPFGSGLPSWQPVGIALGSKPHEAVVLQANRDYSDMRLAVFQMRVD